VRPENEVLEEIRRTLDGTADQAVKYRKIAEILRAAADYRWVGIYEVAGEEIALVAWNGPGEPAHPRFPVSRGLCGEAVRRRSTVISGNVESEPRYLEAFPGTRSEIVVPVLDAVTGRPRAVIDVESERPDAFSDEDRKFLEHCAVEIAAAVSASPG
jgi:L-methionine (R)-S-oxide reductase